MCTRIRLRVTRDVYHMNNYRMGRHEYLLAIFDRVAIHHLGLFQFSCVGVFVCACICKVKGSDSKKER